MNALFKESLLYASSSNQSFYLIFWLLYICIPKQNSKTDILFRWKLPKKCSRVIFLDARKEENCSLLYWRDIFFFIFICTAEVRKMHADEFCFLLVNIFKYNFPNTLKWVCLVLGVPLFFFLYFSIIVMNNVIFNSKFYE